MPRGDESFERAVRRDQIRTEVSDIDWLNCVSASVFAMSVSVFAMYIVCTVSYQSLPRCRVRFSPSSFPHSCVDPDENGED